MGSALKLCAMLAAIALTFGCATKQDSQTAEEKAEALNFRRLQVQNEKDAHMGKQVVNHAQTTLGTPYVSGGISRDGFDCSGLVKWAYNRVGIELPRTAREQSAVGEKVHDVKDMRAGDIVAFRHPKRGYHTGIYVGDGKFIHSPRKRSHVKISSIDSPYFSSTLLGARRVKFDGSTALLAQAESTLENYITEKSKRSLAKSRAGSAVHKSSVKSVAKAATSKSAKKTKGVKSSSPTAKKAGKSVAATKSVKSTTSRKPVNTASLKNSATRAPVKSLASNQRNGRVSPTAKASPRKATGKTVSMLHRKSK